MRSPRPSLGCGFGRTMRPCGPWQKASGTVAPAAVNSSRGPRLLRRGAQDTEVDRRCTRYAPQLGRQAGTLASHERGTTHPSANTQKRLQHGALRHRLPKE